MIPWLSVNMVAFLGLQQKIVEVHGKFFHNFLSTGSGSAAVTGESNKPLPVTLLNAYTPIPLAMNSRIQSSSNIYSPARTPSVMLINSNKVYDESLCKSPQWNPGCQWHCSEKV